MTKDLEAKLAELTRLVRETADSLLCEMHPNACSLRDANYPRFEQLVFDRIFEEEEPVSPLTAMAELELSLSESLGDDIPMTDRKSD